MTVNASAQPDADHRRILIVEDDEDIRSTLTSILVSEGFDVEACTDGRAALAQLATATPPDLIILDLRMPVMDGWQFRVQQKSDPALALIPVIAISADASPQAAAVDAAAYLKKPFDYNSLMNAVERVLQAFDRRRLQSRIKDMDSQSADMRRLKNAFISNVSNQIRKPLNSLLSLTQLIRDGLAGPLTDEQRRYLEVIDRNGQGVLAQLSGILDLANLEDGALPVTVEEIIIAPLVQSTLAPLLPAAHAKGLSIEVQVPEALPRVRADAFRTGQLLRAVLDNAIKFTARGKIKVLAEASAEGPFVEVHICDTGIGIAEDRLPLLFDGFYQVDHRGDASNPGAGLGLTLVDRLARAMGGKVSVQSTVGTGSRFTVMLPAAP